MERIPADTETNNPFCNKKDKSIITCLPAGKAYQL